MYPELKNRTLSTVLDEGFPLDDGHYFEEHHVLKIELKSGERYIIDLMGAKHGWVNDLVLPLQTYLATKTENGLISEEFEFCFSRRLREGEVVDQPVLFNQIKATSRRRAADAYVHGCWAQLEKRGLQPSDLLSFTDQSRTSTSYSKT